ADSHRVLLEAEDDVAMEEVARAHTVREAIDRLLVALAIRVVHRVEQVGSPRQLELHDGQREPRIALEDAGKDHVAQRGGRSEGLGGAAARVPQRLRSTPADLALAPC